MLASFKQLIVLLLSILLFNYYKAQTNFSESEVNRLIKTISKTVHDKNPEDEFSNRIKLIKVYINLPDYILAKKHIDTLDFQLNRLNITQKHILVSTKADYYKYTGESELALHNYLQVYNHFSKSENRNLHFKSCIDLIEFYRKFGDLKRANSFIDSAAILLSKNTISDTSFIIRYFVRAAAVKIEDKKPMASISYSKDALLLAEIVNDKNAMANTYNVLAFTYKNLNQIDTAVKYYLLAEDILFSIQAYREAVNTMFNRIELSSHTYASKEVKKQNIEEYKNLLNKIKTYKITDIDMSRIYLNIANDYGWMGDSISYYKNYILADQYKIDQLIANNTIKVKEIMEKYDNERIKIENASINEKLKMNAKILENEESKSRLYVVLLGSALLFLVFVAVFYYQKQKINKTLTHINSRLTEKNLIIEQKSKELKESLDDRELLLKEIHHRVKNNLQIISGLLELQKEELTEETSKAAFDEGQSRVRSISLIHQNLYQHESLGSIEFKTFVNDLLKQIQEVFGQIDRPIRSTIEIPEKLLDIDTAVPLGLIINELITNSYKYAFSKEKQGEIHIQLTNTGSGNFVLTYSDNGPGIKNGIDFDHAESLGLRLIRGLAGQLHGTASYNYNGFSVFKIEFKDAQARRLD